MKDRLRVILFSALLIILSLTNILSPEKTFSNRENRFLQKMPQLNLDRVMNGKFNEEFQEYTADQFVMRDKWISFKTKIDLSILKKDNGRVYFGKDNYLFEVEEALDKKKFDKNMKDINSFKKQVDVRVDIMLIPSKSTIYKDKLPFKAPVIDEEKLYRDINDNLEDDINLFSPIDLFNKNKNEDLYYKTDHHYTSLGAYYGYSYYMESIGEKPLDQDYFERKTVTDKFLGSMFRKSSYYGGEDETIEQFIPEDKVDIEIIKNENEKLYSLYDHSFLKKSDKYSFFLGGDHPILDIKTNSQNRQTLLLFKDSFANSLIPFLSLQFDRIIVIDKRYFNIPIDEYIKDMDIDRVLFLYNIRTFYDGKVI